MRKRGIRTAAILLTLAVLLGAMLFSAAEPVAKAGTEPTLQELRTETRTDSEPQANRSRKKKNTATPRPTETPAPDGEEFIPTPVPEGPIIDPQSIADYVFAHGELPDNFLTKAEAQALGWDSSRNDVSDVAPGMSIGGDRFGNYERRLPVVHGRQYYEADCFYTGGNRNAYRIIYDNEGHVWYTADHYQTFTELFPTGTKGYVCPVVSPVPRRRR